MAIKELETEIYAPIKRCFNLSRSVDLHIESAEETNERAIAGVLTGMMSMGDIVTWEARHFGIVQNLTVEITKFNFPHFFQDSQVKGIFANFTHDHLFEDRKELTLMKDIFEFRCPFGPIGLLVEPFVRLHLKGFLITRNRLIKEVAESDDRWKKFTSS